MNQRTGKTSFAQIKARLTKEKGRSPSRVELFSSCFVSKDGNSSDAISSKHSAMQELSNQLEESEDIIAPNDIFAQIMGKDKPGHVRMLGQGICPSDVWSETPKSISNRLLMEHQAKIAQLEAMLLKQQRCHTSQVNTRQETSSFDSHTPHATTTLPHLQVGTCLSDQFVH